ncbi:hypothetical protein OROMI_006351 [Orobanche minor]
MVATKPRIYVFPFPAQSHINPMLELSKTLATNDHLNVTFILTTKTSKSTSNITPLNKDSNITIASICDGCDREEVQEQPQAITSDFFKKFEDVVSKSLMEFIVQQNESLFCQPKLILVYDAVFPWMLDIAHKLNMIGASFFTQSCAVTALYYHMRQGSLRFPFEDGGEFKLADALPKLGIDLPASTLKCYGFRP